MNEKKQKTNINNIPKFVKLSSLDIMVIYDILYIIALF